MYNQQKVVMIRRSNQNDPINSAVQQAQTIVPNPIETKVLEFTYDDPQIHTQADEELQIDPTVILYTQLPQQRTQQELEITTNYLKERAMQKQMNNEYDLSKEQKQVETSSNKYLNMKELTKVLRSLSKLSGLISMFIKFSQGELTIAINNIDLRTCPDAFDKLLQCYYILVDSDSIENIDYIREILTSDKFKSLLAIKLERQEEVDGFFFDYYFTKQIVDSFIKLSQITPDYSMIPMKEVLTTIIKMNKVSSNRFQQQQQQIEQLMQPLSQEQLQSYPKQLKQLQNNNIVNTQQDVIIQSLHPIDDIIQTFDYIVCPCEPVPLDFQSDKPAFGQISEMVQVGGYSSIGQYLHNNFYILREDCLRSFRQSIYKLKSIGFNKYKMQAFPDIYAYQLLHSPNIQFTPYGISIESTIRIVDKPTYQIDWDRTKRLIPGSFLLLTNMMFSIVISCSLVSKSVLKNDTIIINLKLIGDFLQTEIKQLKSLITSSQRNNEMILLENTTYFEAYVHYLKSIQSKVPIEYPFQAQIIHGSNASNKPKYLESTETAVVYNLSLDLSDSAIQKAYEVQLFENNWPLTQTLDESQYEAIKLILTHEIAVIQGPPGTGKTFCGAMAVKVLLDNSKYRGKDQILVVCYTNHALDQFLNKILQFVDINDVVRIGGRCKDDNLQQCLLSNQPKVKMHYNWQLFQELKLRLDSIVNYMIYGNKISFEALSQQSCQFITDTFLRRYRIELKNKLQSISNNIICNWWLQNESIISIDTILSIEYSVNNQLIDEQKHADYLAKQQQSREQPINQAQQLKSQFLLGLTNENLEQQDLDIVYGNDSISEVDEESELKAVYYTFFNQNVDRFYQAISNTSEDIWAYKGDKAELYQKRINQVAEESNYFNWDQLLEYRRQCSKIEQAHLDQKINQLKNKKIIGVTVTGCAKYTSILQQLNTKIMIIEEAAEVLESHTAAILNKKLEHLILIGDHQQLRPKIESYYLETKYKTNISLFERLINNKIPYVKLKTQRRMKSKFADFIRLIYGNTYQDHTSIQQQNNVRIKGMQDDLLFFDHQSAELIEQSESSKSNLFEAQMIAFLVKHLLNNGHSVEQLTVLSMYIRQVQLIRQELISINKSVRVQTVDNYQGEENDIIILSLVRSNNVGSLGFIGIDNRICVALSRARIGLYVFGDFTFIHKTIEEQLKIGNSRYSDLWIKIIASTQSMGVLQNKIILQCQQHNQISIVKQIKDWNNQQQNGCLDTCIQIYQNTK